jgi:hypothetical protein
MRAAVPTQPQPSRLQGRAFAAPRQQSLERMHASAADLRQIQAALESSPRKHRPTRSFTEPKQLQRSKSVGKENTKTGNTRIISRPAREIHKVGGISLGSYTIFNNSKNDSSGHSSSSSNGIMEYLTPPSKRRDKVFSSPVRGEGKFVGSALKHVRSIDSFRSHKTTTTNKWRDQFGKEKDQIPPPPPAPPPFPPVSNKPSSTVQLRPKTAHTLGLAHQAPPIPERSSFDQEIRGQQRNEHFELPHRSRFEFKAIAKKSSAVGLKGWLGEKLGRPG